MGRVDERVFLAAADNAAWCRAVCRLHGAPGRLGPRVWASGRRTPPLYPDAVTLSPDAVAADVLAGIDTEAAGASVKDSFARLDLAPHGFDVLFEAQWIHRPAHPPTPAPPPDASGGPVWREVDGPEEFARWLHVWGDGDGSGPLTPGLLADPAVTVLGGWTGGPGDGGGPVAGVIAHRGEGVAAVGLSNLFAADGCTADAAWAGAVAAVSARFPGLPLVGYEHGPDLAAALRHGFAPAGPLRVWLAR
ncbi:hypothetical protein [Streptomyces thermolineatus]|uniref:hypothetical protein n=1 Tax=Streptomyces thermolineatus TaxID=44033 RepID=UPI003851747B